MAAATPVPQHRLASSSAAAAAAAAASLPTLASGLPPVGSPQPNAVAPVVNVVASHTLRSREVNIENASLQSVVKVRTGDGTQFPELEEHFLISLETGQFLLAMFGIYLNVLRNFNIQTKHQNPEGVILKTLQETLKQLDRDYRIWKDHFGACMSKRIDAQRLFNTAVKKWEVYDYANGDNPSITVLCMRVDNQFIANNKKQYAQNWTTALALREQILVVKAQLKQLWGEIETPYMTEKKTLTFLKEDPNSVPVSEYRAKLNQNIERIDNQFVLTLELLADLQVCLKEIIIWDTRAVGILLKQPFSETERPTVFQHSELLPPILKKLVELLRKTGMDKMTLDEALTKADHTLKQPKSIQTQNSMSAVLVASAEDFKFERREAQRLWFTGHNIKLQLETLSLALGTWRDKAEEKGRILVQLGAPLLNSPLPEVPPSCSPEPSRWFAKRLTKEEYDADVAAEALLWETMDEQAIAQIHPDVEAEGPSLKRKPMQKHRLSEPPTLHLVDNSSRESVAIRGGRSATFFTNEQWDLQLTPPRDMILARERLQRVQSSPLNQPLVSWIEFDRATLYENVNDVLVCFHDYCLLLHMSFESLQVLSDLKIQDPYWQALYASKVQHLKGTCENLRTIHSDKLATKITPTYRMLDQIIREMYVEPVPVPSTLSKDEKTLYETTNTHVERLQKARDVMIRMKAFISDVVAQDEAILKKVEDWLTMQTSHTASSSDWVMHLQQIQKTRLEFTCTQLATHYEPLFPVLQELGVFPAGPFDIEHYEEQLMRYLARLNLKTIEIHRTRLKNRATNNLQILTKSFIFQFVQIEKGLDQFELLKMRLRRLAWDCDKVLELDKDEPKGSEQRLHAWVSLKARFDQLTSNCSTWNASFDELNDWLKASIAIAQKKIAQRSRYDQQRNFMLLTQKNIRDLMELYQRTLGYFSFSQHVLKDHFTGIQTTVQRIVTSINKIREQQDGYTLIGRNPNFIENPLLQAPRRVQMVSLPPSPSSSAAALAAQPQSQ